MRACKQQLQSDHVIAKFLLPCGTLGFAALPCLSHTSNGVLQLRNRMWGRGLLRVVKDPEGVRKGFIFILRIREKRFHESVPSLGKNQFVSSVTREEGEVQRTWKKCLKTASEEAVRWSLHPRRNVTQKSKNTVGHLSDYIFPRFPRYSLHRRT